MTVDYGALHNGTSVWAARELLRLVTDPPPRPIQHTSPSWQEMVDAMDASDCRRWLKVVLRSRRRYFYISIPTCQREVPRAELRDYLRQRHLPIWMRHRPLPASAGETIKFRRYVPFDSTEQSK